ncbi:hypothetical protein EVAR_61510_1 [Eumeta japonica]|uniref:Uncharacterized protein n=1 Tax=Eumeta variegata TaxID=151549 RepID=A0A4C2A7Y1_EUMVA|nr:hypothetical protein EVAR_61510_1 [Eumeta japonica]
MARPPPVQPAAGVTDVLLIILIYADTTLVRGAADEPSPSYVSLFILSIVAATGGPSFACSYFFDDPCDPSLPQDVYSMSYVEYSDFSSDFMLQENSKYNYFYGTLSGLEFIYETKRKTSEYRSKLSLRAHLPVPGFHFDPIRSYQLLPSPFERHEYHGILTRT